MRKNSNTESVLKAGEAFDPREHSLFSYVRLPRGLLESRDLSDGAKLTWALLADCGRDDGCFPGHKYLAAALGISVPSIKRYLGELRRANLIQADQPESAPDRRNRYWFIWQDVLDKGSNLTPTMGSNLNPYGIRSDPIMGSNLNKHGIKNDFAYKEEESLRRNQRVRARLTRASAPPKQKKVAPAADPNDPDGLNIPESELHKWRTS